MSDGVTEVDLATSIAGAAAPRPGPVDWLLVALITLLAGWSAVVALAYLPLYIGAVPFPISALLGVAAMILAPWGCYRLTGSLVAALLPVLVWFGISVWVVLTRNAIMPTLPLTVIAGQWRVMLLLGLGALAAAASIGLIWGDRLRLRLAAQQPARSAAIDPAGSIGGAEPDNAGNGSTGGSDPRPAVRD